MGTFLIREVDGSLVEREPTEGKWYCGMTETFIDGAPDIDGEMGQYTANGEFVDEAPDYADVDMNGYDYLAEQY